MTTSSAPVSAAIFGDSGWANAAALLLIGCGAVVAAFGIVTVVEGLNYDDPGGIAMGYNILAIVIGSAIVATGLVHAAAGVFVLRHHSWARVLGIVIGVLGGLLALAVLPTAFNTVYTGGISGQVVAAGPEPLSVMIGLSLVPYVLIVVGLVLGGRQFKRQTYA